MRFLDGQFTPPDQFTGTVSTGGRSAAIEAGKVNKDNTPYAPMVHGISGFISGLVVHSAGMRRNPLGCGGGERWKTVAFAAGCVRAALRGWRGDARGVLVRCDRCTPGRRRCNGPYARVLRPESRLISEG